MKVLNYYQGNHLRFSFCSELLPFNRNYRNTPLEMTTLWILLLNICSYAGKSRPINPCNMMWWVYSFLKWYAATFVTIPHSQSSIGNREPFLENRVLWMLVRYPVTTSILQWNQGARSQPETYWVSHLPPVVLNQQISGKLTLCVMLTPGSPVKGQDCSNCCSCSRNPMQEWW